MYNHDHAREVSSLLPREPFYSLIFCQVKWAFVLILESLNILNQQLYNKHRNCLL